MHLLLLLPNLITDTLQLLLIPLQRLISLFFLLRDDPRLALEDGQLIALGVVLAELLLHLGDEAAGVHHLGFEDHELVLGDGGLGQHPLSVLEFFHALVVFEGHALFYQLAVFADLVFGGLKHLLWGVGRG